MFLGLFIYMNRLWLRIQLQFTIAMVSRVNLKCCKFFTSIQYFLMPRVEQITSTFHLHLLLSTYKPYATCVLLSPMFFRISRCINNPKLELTSDTHDSQFSSTISFYFFYDTAPFLDRLWIQFTASEERTALKVPPTRVKLDRDSGA